MNNSDLSPQSPLQPSADQAATPKWQLLDKPKRLSVIHGTDWISDAWHLFKKQPWFWVAVMFGLIAFTMLFSVLFSYAGTLQVDAESGLPVLPSWLVFVNLSVNLIFGVLSLVLVAGFWRAADNSSRTGNAKFTDLFAGFGKIGQLLVFGLLLLLVTALPVFIIALIAFAFIDEIYGVLFAHSLSFLSWLLLFVLLMVYNLIATWVMYIGSALITLNDIGVWRAFVLSLKGTIYNIAPILLYSFVGAILSFMMIFTLGLGLFVIAPMLFLGVYIAHRQIFYTDLNADLSDTSTLDNSLSV